MRVRPKIADLAEREQTQDVRRRFLEFKRRGHSNEEAARLANEGAEPEETASPEPEEKPERRSQMAITPGELIGTGVGVSDGEPTKTGVVVPQGWRDLAWPQLRELAGAIAGSSPQSRKDANEIVTAYLAQKKG